MLNFHKKILHLVFSDITLLFPTLLIDFETNWKRRNASDQLSTGTFEVQQREEECIAEWFTEEKFELHNCRTTFDQQSLTKFDVRETKSALVKVLYYDFTLVLM